MPLRIDPSTEVPGIISISELETALSAIQSAADSKEEGLISLAFVDELTARTLNKQFADNDYATDVLSFNYFEHEANLPTSEDVVGEIVICMPVAERQANEHGSGLEAELMLLFVHGVLHILGYDHDGVDEASFQALQDGIMDKLKVKSRDIFDGNIH